MNKALLMGEHRASFPDNKFRSTGKEYYEWKIYKNPFMEGFIYLEIRDENVVGSSTATPKKVAILNEKFLAAELGDSFTLPEYRKQGINLKALNRCTQYAITNGMNLVYGGPANPANYRLLLKVGLLPCSYTNYTFLSKSLNQAFFITKLIAKIVIWRNPNRNCRYLKYLLKRKLTRPKSVHSYEKYHENDFSIEVINKFAENIDGLWGKPRYVFVIFRDSSYLNWRYFENPDKYTILAATKDKEYLGYMALKMSKDNTAIVICDFITVNDRSDVFMALVNKSEEIAKQNGADLIQTECIVDSAYHKTLGELGYYDHGPESYQSLTIYSKTKLGERVLKNFGKWHFTLGDSDEV